MKKPSLKRHNKGVFYGFFNEPKLNKNLAHYKCRGDLGNLVGSA